MAPAVITQPVLSGNPKANCDAYIVGLLDELRERIDSLPVRPSGDVTVRGADLVALRGTFLAASVAIRNLLKWQS